MTFVGVDGCKAGWVAVYGPQADDLKLTIHTAIADLVAAFGIDALIAVDMPIGLPDRIEGPGRAAEQAVRPKLGGRQSSVFTIPARAVVEMGAQMTGRTADDYPLHKRASALARTLSSPPRGVSIQAFYLFPKILEIDALLRADVAARERVFESHPEAAFCALNGGDAMRLPKKVKGKVNLAGMDERRALLARYGVKAGFLTDPPPRGAGSDDVLDAAVSWLIVQRIASGQATPHPNPPARDRYGLPIAIWA